MFTFIQYRRLVSLWAVLLVLSGVSTAWAQSFQVSPKTCVPDRECNADPVVFTDSVSTGVTSRTWDFGDGATLTTQGDSVIARHVYQQAGTYTVQLTRTVSGTSVISDRSIQVYDRPQPFPQWRTDTTICIGEEITLDPYANSSPPSGTRFLWYPKGETTQSIKVDSSGCYSVEAISPNGCSYQDRINVDVCGEKKESQGVKWYFGQNAGLDFSGGGAPRPVDDGKLNTIEGSSSIANTKGILLFYTDGITIYDKDGKPLKSLDPRDSAATATPIPLGGNRNSTQSALIVPKPTCRGCEYLYYVYTTSEINGTKQLTYSIVDMRQNGGKGAVVEKNIPVTQQASEQSVSVQNERDSTYWVITRVYGTNTYEVRHLTRDENTAPLQPPFEGGQKLDSLSKGEGYMKIGPADTTSANNASRPMAVVVPGGARNSVDLFTFNDSTGAITFNRTLDLGPAPPKAYGVEFSPDGKSLYVTMLADTNADGSQKGSSYILKYDLTQTDPRLITSSRTVIDSSTTRQYGSVQIGPDGRIYVAIQGSSSLGTIENPNGGLLDSLRFIPNGQTLGGKTSQLGLPNLVSNFNDNSSGPGLAYSDTCVNAPTVFQISPNCPKLKETYTLDFGDGSRPTSTTALQPITHGYARPGEYAVSLRIVTLKSDGNGICQDTTIRDTLTIREVPPPVNLGPDTTICNRKGLTLDLKVPAEIYVWLVNGQVTGRGQRTITLQRPGYYIVVGFAANGECFQNDTIEVQIKPPPSLDLGPDTVFCYRSTVTLTVPQRAWTQFQWSNGGTTRDISVSKAGTYTVTAQLTTDGSVCENTDSIRVAELPQIRLRAALTGPTACTSADGVIALTPTPAGTYTYAWTRSDGAILSDSARQINLPEGNYSVQVTDTLHACEADSVFTLKSPINQLQLTPDVKAALCSIPNSGTISLRATGGTPITYTWLNANNISVATGAIFDQAAPGLYGVEVRDANGCKVILDSIRVGLDSSAFARLAPPPVKCAGEPVELAPEDADTPGNVYQWSTGATTRAVNVSQPGAYSLVVRNTLNGCVGRSSVQVSDRPAPVFSLTREAAICVGDRGQAQLAVSGDAALRFLWPALGDTTRRVLVSQVGQYEVRATDPAGCTATATARVENRCEPRLLMPDAFSPNGDGVNDQLDVFTAYITDYELKVYNRWGEVIFASTNPEQKWDGTYKSQAYPSMLYPYVVSFKSESYPDRARVVKRGSVLLVR